jgi:ubiquinone/menaquinone biosynthesis C-methylase UbiE
MPSFIELKPRHHVLWSSGDHDQIARTIQTVAKHVVHSARIRAGERVLAIACGTWNIALLARARGAAVTGLDLMPDLLGIARRRAREAGYGDIAWEEGDAESLPFPDSCFDVILSVCGLMFAPDQQQVAREVARVTRRGGRIAIQAWTREGGVGRMFQVAKGHVPLPSGAACPFNWGNEEKVKSLLGSSFTDYRFDRYDCPECADTPEQAADLFIHRYGRTYRAYRALAAEKVAAFREDLIDLYRGYVTPADGKVRWGRDYVITVATRA